MAEIEAGQMMEETISDGVDSSQKEDTELEMKKSKGRVKIPSKQKKKEDRWKPAEIDRFLELYKMYPCLWDYKVPAYKDRNAKEYSWEEIVKFMEKKDLTVKKAKDKIRVLRNTYINQLTKIQKRKTSGKGLDDEYTPTLRWFNTMDRIVGKVVKSRGSLPIGLPDEKLPDTQLQENLMNVDVDEPIEIEIQRIEDTVEPLSPATSFTANVTCVPRETPATKPNNPYARPLSIKVVEQRLDKIETAVSELKVITCHGTSSVQTKCEFDMFGQLISTQLKKLPEVEALSAMQEIQSCLFRRRMACANRSRNILQEPQYDEADYNTNTSTRSSISSPSLQENITIKGKKNT